MEFLKSCWSTRKSGEIGKYTHILCVKIMCVADLMHNLAQLTSYLRMQIDVNTVVSFLHLFIATAIACVVNQYFLHYYTNNLYHAKNKSSHSRDSRPFIFCIIKRNSKEKKLFSIPSRAL